MIAIHKWRKWVLGKVAFSIPHIWDTPGPIFKGKLSPDSSFQADIIFFLKKELIVNPPSLWFFGENAFFIVSVLLLIISIMIGPCSKILQSCVMNCLLSPAHSSKQPSHLLLASPSTAGPVKSRGTYLHGSRDLERDFLYSESWNKLATVFLPFSNGPEWHIPVRRMWLPNPPRPGDHEALSRV